MRSQPGPDDCGDTVAISMSGVIISIPPGTVCIDCSVGGEVAHDTVFEIDGFHINASIGRVVNGVLVVFDTESVFSSTTDVRCMSVSLSTTYLVSMYLESKSHYRINPISDTIYDIII